MKTIDFSRATFADIARELGDLRLCVWRGLRQHGPCTTADLAKALDMSVLTVRPRVTELMSAGLVMLSGDRRGHEGVYAALDIAQAAALQRRAVEGCPAERQLDLRIHA